MLTRTPFTDHPTIAPDAAAVSDDGPHPTAAAEQSALLVRMDSSDPQLAVLAVSGDLDSATTPRLAQLLWPRLLTKLPAITVDLSELTFLGVAGLELLANAHTYAHQRGVTLSIVNSTRTVDRALAAGGLDAILPCFASVPDARAAAVRVPVDVLAVAGHEHAVRPTAV